MARCCAGGPVVIGKASVPASRTGGGRQAAPAPRVLPARAALLRPRRALRGDALLELLKMEAPLGLRDLRRRDLGRRCRLVRVHGGLLGADGMQTGMSRAGGPDGEGRGTTAPPQSDVRRCEGQASFVEEAGVPASGSEAAVHFAAKCSMRATWAIG